MKYLTRLLLAGGLMATAGAVHADEADFLQSLDGDWSGKGMVKVRTDSSPVNVSCSFDSDATATSLSLDGNCRGMIIISRAIGADLKASGLLHRRGHRHGRPQRKALGQRHQSRHPLGERSEWRPRRPDDGQEGRRKRHDPDHRRHRSEDRQERGHQSDQPSPFMISMRESPPCGSALDIFWRARVAAFAERVARLHRRFPKSLP
jgi:hypothetical protein